MTRRQAKNPLPILEDKQNVGLVHKALYEVGPLDCASSFLNNTFRSGNYHITTVLDWCVYVCTFIS